LANVTGDKEQEYFADGITDELIGNLAKIGAVRVISRTSVMRYKETKKPLPEIARELNVDAVVEGTVARFGNRVRITAQLIDGRDDRHLWADQYESDVRDVLTVQDEVAQHIASEIRVRLTPEEHARFASARPVNPEAHEAYLRGRYHLDWGKGTDEELNRAIEYFRQAIEQDPGYAQAYVGLAESYILKGNWGLLPGDEAYSKAKAAAVKALEIDNTSGEAYAARAYTRFAHDRDWSGAEEDFNKAIELNPNFASARLWHTLYLRAAGRFDEAILEAKRGRELDPLSPLISATVGSTFYWAREYAKALPELQKALDLDPNFPLTHSYLGRVYRQERMYEPAITEFQKSGDRDELAIAYALAGRKTQALKVVEELKGQSKPSADPCTPRTIAIVYAGLGEKDQAFRWLEEDNKDCEVPSGLKHDPLFDVLHSDPRFQDLLRRMHYSQ
jgi:TolB-like protein/Tfp pilus assembly protein PilF